MVPIRWQADPMSGEGARLSGGRWNRKGQPALYLATDPATAVSEFYGGLAKPGTLAPFELHAARIADLAQADQPDVAGALAADWKTSALIEDRFPPSWTLAAQLIEAGAEGALVPSVQNRGGINLVLWRWHDAGAGGQGAALTLLDPDAGLGGRA